jgi:hypothetical protein
MQRRSKPSASIDAVRSAPPHDVALSRLCEAGIEGRCIDGMRVECPAIAYDFRSECLL